MNRLFPKNNLAPLPRILKTHLRLIFCLSPLVTSFLIFGCYRGLPHDDEPIEVIQDMYHQPKYKPQSQSQFFADSMTMRPIVAGTVAQGQLHEDSAYFTGFVKDDIHVKTMPVHITLDLLKRGQERFNIFCSPCHGRTGDGNGIVVQHGFVPPPSYHTDAIRQYPDGHIFHVITEGIRTMPSYGNQVPVADRWAIVSYIRALQLSQNAPLKDVPPEVRQRIK
jgi:hypothetical protein